MLVHNGFLSIGSRRQPRVRLALALVLSLGVMSVGVFDAPAPAQGSSALTPIDLGTLGGPTSIAVAVSGSVVYGYAETDLVTGSGTHVFAYDLDADSPSMEDLGTLPGGSFALVEAASGNVAVGFSDITGGAQHAFAYDRGAASPRMRDLGTLGGTTSRAEAVSGSIVVGSSYIPGDVEMHAFAYDLSATPGAMQDLGTFGGRYTEALAVSGDIVVGRSVDGASGDWAFAYDLAHPDVPMKNLGSLGSGTESEAQAVSGNVVVGYSYLVGDSGERHAFLYDLTDPSASMQDLGTLGGLSSRAGVVSGNIVAGDSTTAGGQTHALAYDLGAASPQMLDLGTLGGSTSSAEAVSGNIVVGGSALASGDQRGFAYDLGASTPSMHELGTLGGSLSRAAGVSGTVIAGYSTTAEGALHAVAWDLGPAADTAGPDVTIGSPAAGATYTVGDAATASFSCADPSGVTTCTGTLNGNVINSGDPLNTSITGTFTLSVSGVDSLGNTSTRSASYIVVALPGGAASSVTGGGTVTTDPGGAGASPAVPVQTAITAPEQVSGVLTVTPQTATTPPPAGFSLFGTDVVITGPPASAASPYDVSFMVDSSVLGGVAPADVQVFRNGVPLTGCTDATAAIPDPCVVSRGFAPGGAGDALVRVRTSQFSTWSLGRLRYQLTGPFQPVDPAPTVNTAKAGSAIPVKFKLGGDKGLDVLVAGYPKSGTASCGTAASDEIEQMVSGTGSALTYDSASGQYSYKWKTTTAMKGCRDLVLKFKDGSSITATFNLR